MGFMDSSEDGFGDNIDGMEIMNSVFVRLYIENQLNKLAGAIGRQDGAEAYRIIMQVESDGFPRLAGMIVERLTVLGLKTLYNLPSAPEPEVKP